MDFCRTDEGGSQTGIEMCRRWMGEEGDEERCDNHVGTFTAEGVYRGPHAKGGYILSSWLGNSNASGRLLRQARHLTNRGGDSDGKCWWAYGRRTNEAELLRPEGGLKPQGKDAQTERYGGCFENTRLWGRGNVYWSKEEKPGQVGIRAGFNDGMRMTKVNLTREGRRKKGGQQDRHGV
eukprot:g59596.t1